MKAILMSYDCYWLYLIVKGLKTVEIRKSKVPLIDDYCYCNKSPKNLYKVPLEDRGMVRSWLGKVVAKFTVKKVENLKDYQGSHKDAHFYEVLKNACLTTDELQDYCPIALNKYKNLYALYISNLVIFDKPKEIGEFKKTRKSWKQEDIDYVSKAPQSWQYIEVEK